MLKYTLIYLPGFLLPRLASFFVLIAAAHSLEPAQVGLMSLVILVGEVTEGIALNWLRITFIRMFGHVRSVSRHAAVTAGKVALPALLVSVLLAGVLSPMLAGDAAPRFFAVAAAYLVANSMLKFGLMFLQVAGRRKLYSGGETLRALLIIAVTLVGLGQGLDGLAVMTAITTVTALFAATFLTLTWRWSIPDEVQADARLMLSNAAPLITLSVLNFGMTSLDRFALGTVHGAAVVGIYAASYALARQGFDVLANAINTGGFPELVAAHAKGEDKVLVVLKRQATIVLSLLLTALTGIVLIRNDLALAALPPEYLSSANLVIPIVALGAVALNVKNTLTDNVLLLLRRNVQQMWGLGAGAAVTALLLIVLIPQWQELGAALSFCAGSATCLLISWLQSRRHMRIGMSMTLTGAVVLPVALTALVCLTTSWLGRDLHPFLRLGVSIGLSAPLALLAINWLLNKQKNEHATGWIENA